MKFIVVLPNIEYYLWQMLVQINNFKKFGYDKDSIYIIGNINNNSKNILLKNIGKLNIGSDFYFYNDERINKKYPSSLRPHLLKKFFKENNWIENESFLYLDPDVIFTKKINFTPLLKDDIWYVSDTKSYISSNYIKSKSNDLFIEMCNIVGVEPNIIENNDDNAGGAQYLIKNVDYKFWEEVEYDSEKLYEHMANTSNLYSPESPIQAWTADMWSILWNAWYFKHDVKINKLLDFSWATDSIDAWKKKSIFHNAGVSNQENIFNKTKYQISPFNKDLSFVDKKNNTYNYVKEIKDTEKNYKEFLF